MESQSNPNRLVIRLSSLGDVVLATRFLESLPAGEKVDWIVSKEFAPLLQRHPRINRLISFDRSDSLIKWIKLGLDLSKQGYAEFHDLHCSLRSRILRAILLLKSPATKQFRVPKQRFRLMGFFTFKKKWPKHLRPESWGARYAGATGCNPGETKPWLPHLASGSRSETIIGLMPSSAWPGKNWNIALLLPVLGKILTDHPEIRFEVLGSSRDEASRDLYKRMQHRFADRVQSSIGMLSLLDLAKRLSEFKAVITVDTGIGHLAESMGIPTLVTFGPTHPDQGFAPTLPASQAVISSLWCAPCSKDGSACFRIKNRFLCQTKLDTHLISQWVAGQVSQ